MNGIFAMNERLDVFVDNPLFTNVRNFWEHQYRRIGEFRNRNRRRL
jgi:hypothetical protein